MKTTLYLNKQIKLKNLNRFGIFLMLMLVSLFTEQINAQNFHLVKDINNLTDANPGNHNYGIMNYTKNNFFAVLNGISYFAANDGVNGVGLWRTDGSSAGTYQVKDSINPRNIIIYNGKLLFIADGITGLWVSDGTDAGTVPVLNVMPPGLNFFFPEGLIDMNGIAFFSITGNQGAQLWKTDGTPNGTMMVKDLFVQNNHFYYPRDFTVIKNKLYFTAYTSDFATTRLWVSNGSLAGTNLVSNNIAEPSQMIARSSNNLDSMVYFTGAASPNGSRSLYFTTGQAGVAGIASGFTGVVANNYWRQDLLNINGYIYFIGSPDTTAQNNFLYKYDVNNPGVTIVKNVVGTNSTNGPANIFNVADLNGILFFSLFDATNNKNQLWKSDGTILGNVLLKDSLYSSDFTPAGGLMYFEGFDNTTGSELWKSDGTIKGTMLVKDIHTGSGGCVPASLTYANSKLLFSATDDVHGNELWQSDGTLNGTSMVKDINQASTTSSGPDGLTAFKNELFFTAYEGTSTKLWKSDGTNAGTVVVSDSVFASAYQNFLTVNNQVYFWGYSAFGKFGMFKTDGSPGGTVLIKDFTGSQLSFYGIIATGNLVYFYLLNYSNSTYELWRSDGTSANTFMIKNDINYSDSRKFVAVGNKLFFAVPGSGNLWVTDGSIAGTILVKTFFATPTELVAHNGLLFLSVFDGSYVSLWKSDGSSIGTVKITDNVTNASNFISSNGSLFFTAFGNAGIFGNIGQELYKTDGTANGTVLVKNIHPGNTSSSIYSLNNLNGILYFFTDGTVSAKPELWKTDGTDVGTKLISVIGNSDYGYPPKVVTSNGKLLFFLGNLLWESDGIAGGTHPVADNIFSSITVNDFNSNLTVSGTQLFFTAYSRQYGHELYAGTISPAIQSYISATDGDWNNPATWIGNIVPPDGYNVIIRHNVLANINALCKTLTVALPGGLTVGTGIKITVLN